MIRAWDQEMGIETKAMLCCPMIHGSKLMGILQVINTRVVEPFDSNHEKNIIAVAQMLAIAFHNNSKFVQAKPHKFSYLINEGILSPEELESSLIAARKAKVDLENVLLQEREIKRSDLGKSLESYYGVPYFGYNDSTLLPKSYFEGLNKKHLIKNHWVPIHQEESSIVVLLDDPSDIDKVRSIKTTFPKGKSNLGLVCERILSTISLQLLRSMVPGEAAILKKRKTCPRFWNL